MEEVYGMRLTSTGFGIFVIFAAIYAAGTLGIGRPEVAGVEVKVGEIGAPLVALFGMPALVGLVFGQFIANSASPLGPLDMASPLVSLAGLLVIWYMRRRLVIVGSIIYAAITSPWLAFLISNTQAIQYPAALVSALASQVTAVITGYIIYEILRRAPPFKQEAKAAQQEAEAVVK
ncbi:MAG TPA: QueT transporter family protein [Aigarchaeota archaeon]|nr:QueT transporter family protein [Aigarchaeota archaeon]